MKKIIALLLALLMVLSLAACGKKPAGNEGQTSDTPQTQSGENSDVNVEGDPAEYSMDFWAEKYPGENICPFSIEEGGVEKPYYLVMSMGCAMADWIGTPFNWNGWHKVGNDIVNKDETYKMTEEWIGENASGMFSSGCVVTTEPYDPNASAQVPASSGYNFSGYTETADWPAAEMWKSYGLPELTVTDDVSGSVHISDKSYIYPLNGSDGILIEARPASSQIDAIVDTLTNAGVEMNEDQDFEKGYVGYYDNNGSKMKITVSETGSGKLTVLIVTNPTDN